MFVVLNVKKGFWNKTSWEPMMRL